MIIPFLIKHFRTILDALIIAAIVVAFAFFDPFHLFNSKVNVRNTPVAVESIRQIGQLITTEYYGETIASLPQTLTDTITDEQILNEAQTLSNELLSAISNLKALSQGKKPALKIKEKNIETTFLDSNAWLARSRFYPFIIKYFAGYFNIKQSKNYTEKVLWKIYSTSPTRIDLIPAKFLKDISSQNRKAYQEIKKNIVYIGRGWVKAGIDFGKLKASDISYSPANKTIYIKNCETRILDCDINPWFIPGKVKGYELIKEKGSFENPFAEAVKVKKRCVENLRVQAIKSGILEQANQNAKESLKNLFSLLTGNEITEVVFTTDKFDRIFNEIKTDKKISDSEAILINEVIQKSLKETDTLAYNDYRRQLSDLGDFCKNLQQYQYAGTTINGYSLDLAVYLKNDTINPFQLEKAATILSPGLSLDSIDMKNAMFRFMANYNLSQNDFVDSCMASGILKTTKTKTEHKLASLTKIYRDSLYSQCIQIGTATLQKPENRYAIWFKNEVEADSARIQIFRRLQKANPEL